MEIKNKERLDIDIDPKLKNKIVELCKNNELITLNLTPAFIIEIAYYSFIDKIAIDNTLFNKVYSQYIENKTENSTGRFTPTIYTETKNEMKKFKKENQIYSLAILTEIILMELFQDLEKQSIEQLTINYLNNCVGDGNE